MTTKTTAFSFSNEIIPTASQILNMFECSYTGKFYELPFSINAHSKYFSELTYLRSGIQCKANILSSCFKPHKLLGSSEFSKIAMDYLWFGNCYIELIYSKTGKLIKLKHSPAKYTRRDKNDKYVFLKNNEIYDSEIHKFQQGSIIHLFQYDVNQELYGLPDWLSFIQSSQLNNEATKFRLRYYRNGSHAGYVMYITDENIKDDDIDKLKEDLRRSKGPGNFKNLLLHSPGGDKDGLKLIPISEVTAKDEFLKMKTTTRDDQLAAIRIPPNLMGVVPENAGGFGNVTQASSVFARNEIKPLQNIFEEINHKTSKNIIIFDDYKVE